MSASKIRLPRLRPIWRPGPQITALISDGTEETLSSTPRDLDYYHDTISDWSLIGGQISGQGSC